MSLRFPRRISAVNIYDSALKFEKISRHALRRSKREIRPPIPVNTRRRQENVWKEECQTEIETTSSQMRRNIRVVPTRAAIARFQQRSITGDIYIQLSRSVRGLTRKKLFFNEVRRGKAATHVPEKFGLLECMFPRVYLVQTRICR